MLCRQPNGHYETTFTSSSPNLWQIKKADRQRQFTVTAVGTWTWNMNFKTHGFAAVCYWKPVHVIFFSRIWGQTTEWNNCCRWKSLEHRSKLLFNVFRPKLINSFILNIYIAPLQENYSEALSTPARLQRAVLTLKGRKNAGDKALGKIRSSEGSPYHIEGPTTEKARPCLVEVRANGTRRRPCWDERSDRELITLSRGQQSSRRLTYAPPPMIGRRRRALFWCY